MAKAAMSRAKIFARRARTRGAKICALPEPVAPTLASHTEQGEQFGLTPTTRASSRRRSRFPEAGPFTPDLRYEPAPLPDPLPNHCRQSISGAISLRQHAPLR